MATLTPLHELQQRLAAAFPAARFRFSRPATDQGVWFLDVACGDEPLTVQWQPGKPFGLYSSNTGGYGERPDEVYDDADDAYERIAVLLRTGRTTQPSPEATLRREAVG